MPRLVPDGSNRSLDYQVRCNELVRPRMDVDSAWLACTRLRWQVEIRTLMLESRYTLSEDEDARAAFGVFEIGYATRGYQLPRLLQWLGRPAYRHFQARRSA